MKTQIGQVSNIYDLLALLCSYILEQVQINMYEFYDFDDSDYTDVYDAIEKYVNDIDEKGHKNAFKNFHHYIIGFLDNEINIEKCFAIVKYIDEMVSYEMPTSLGQYEEVMVYNTISEKYQEEVRIIPKLKNTLLLNEGEFLLKDIVDPQKSLFRDAGECYCSPLDEVMLNYMVWDKDKVKHFPVNIYRINDNGFIGRHFIGRRKLTIGLVPLTCQDIEDILDIEYHNKTFAIKGVKDEAKDALKERYIDAYKRSLSKDIDFLIYPEMLGTEDILDSLKELDNSDAPQFIVNGTIWDSYCNRCILTDGKGNEIFTYYKRASFKYKKDRKVYKEYLKEQNSTETYPILEIEGVGRVGICICKDLAQEDILMFHKYIKTDLLLVPAFSNSMRLTTDAGNLAEKYNCLTVLANACAAYKEHWNTEVPKNIGFLALPAKEKNANVGYIKKYCADVCENTCEEKCVGKLFTLSFSDIESYGAKFSIDIKETTF